VSSLDTYPPRLQRVDPLAGGVRANAARGTESLEIFDPFATRGRARRCGALIAGAVTMSRSVSRDELDAIVGGGSVETFYQPTFAHRAQRALDDAWGTVQRNWDDAWRIAGYDMPSRLPSNVEDVYLGPSMVQQAYRAIRPAYDAVASTASAAYDAGARAAAQYLPSGSSESPPLLDADPFVAPSVPEQDVNQFVAELDTPTSGSDVPALEIT
jgi:hypothetical protein